MAYNNVTDRTDVDRLIPYDVSREIQKNVTENSAVLQLARRRPNIPRKEHIIPVFSTKPTAYFVDGDTGYVQTSEAAWTNVTLTAEMLSVLIPIPDTVFNDADYDLWAELRPEIEEAMGVAVDAAQLFGTNKPSSWPTALVTAAAAKSQSVDLSTTITGGGDLYDAILGESGVHALLEADGFMPTGQIAALSLRGKIRGLRDANGQPIFARMPESRTGYTLDGVDIAFPKNGAFDAATALLLAGQWDQLVWALREDMTFRIYSEGVVTDNTGAVQLNLMQQNAKAMKVTMRLGFALPNPVNRVNSNSTTRYPFATLVP